MKEVFKDIPNYVGYYQVSNLGNVRSLDRTITYKKGVPTERAKCGKKLLKGRPIKLQTNKAGYQYVILNKNNKKKSLLVHRLVAIAFLDNINNLPEVNHLDGIKSNNYIDNLEWSNSSNNVEHAYKTGLMTTKLSNQQVVNIKQLIKQGLTQREIGAMFGVSKSTIGYISRGLLWKNVV